MPSTIEKNSFKVSGGDVESSLSVILVMQKALPIFACQSREGR